MQTRLGTRPFPGTAGVGASSGGGADAGAVGFDAVRRTTRSRGEAEGPTRGEAARARGGIRRAEAIAPDRTRPELAADGLGTRRRVYGGRGRMATRDSLLRGKGGVRAHCSKAGCPRLGRIFAGRDGGWQATIVVSGRERGNEGRTRGFRAASDRYRGDRRRTDGCPSRNLNSPGAGAAAFGVVGFIGKHATPPGFRFSIDLRGTPKWRPARGPLPSSAVGRLAPSLAPRASHPCPRC